jgi:hypothetical protein
MVNFVTINNVLNATNETFPKRELLQNTVSHQSAKGSIKSKKKKITPVYNVLG